MLVLVRILHDHTTSGLQDYKLKLDWHLGLCQGGWIIGETLLSLTHRPERINGILLPRKEI
jgi:hypothetical protein